MSNVPEISGRIDQRFSRVREAFEENFKKGLEIGAAVSIWVDGRPVVDLWAGYADRERERLWQQDTLVNVYSATKGMTAICIHQLLERGLIDLNEKVARYWPEFAQAGKKDIPVHWLLSHQAGVPAVGRPLPPEAIFDWQTMTSAVAAQAPWWEPGTRHGYHVRTFGWLLGELARRVTGQTLGNYFREAVAGPLGLDFHIGLSDDHHYRVASITPLPKSPPNVEPNLTRIFLQQPDCVTSKAFMNPPNYRLPDCPNSPQWRRAELPASNGHGTARSVAKFYGTLACGGELNGVRILTPESIEKARTQQSRGLDEVLQVETRFGLGFMLQVPGLRMGPNDRAFGHPGAGGSLGFADPEARIGFGYVMNRTGHEILADIRSATLVKALYESL